jgi:hypothetical protein
MAEVSTGAHPDAEDLAALAAGQLPASRRRELLAHLDRCPECYEVFTDTVAFLEQEEAAAEPAPVVRFPERGESWSAWRAVAAVLVLAVGAGVLLWLTGGGRGESPLMLASVEVLSPLHQVGALAAAAERPWYGAEALGFGGTETSRRVVRLGAALVDTGAALAAAEAGDSAAISRAVGALDGLLPGDQETWAAPRRAFVRFRRAPSSNTLTRLEGEVEEVLSRDEAPYLAFGRWVEAGRLAAEVGEAALFRSRVTQEAFAALAAQGWPEEIRHRLAELLPQVQRLGGPPPEGGWPEEVWDELERDLEELLTAAS